MRCLNAATLAPLASLKIPRGDGANLETPRATVTQISGLGVATLRPFSRSHSWRATVTQVRALEVATLAPCDCC